jgi:hypothetical protein
MSATACGTPTKPTSPLMRTLSKGGAPRVGCADALDAAVCAEVVGDGLDGLDRILAARGDDVGGSELGPEGGTVLCGC